MAEPETLALLDMKETTETPEKSLPQALVQQPEEEGGTESPGAESLIVGSSVGSPIVREGPENGPDSTISEAATLPWGTDPHPSAPLPDPPGWRDIEPEPLESETATKSEDPLKEDASLLPEKTVRAFVPIDLQCIERKPQERILHREAGPGELRNFLPARLSHPEPPECKWAEAVVRPPGRSCGGCGSCGGREALRAVASVVAALIFFPCLLYGAYAFLPFDAPRLPTMSSRLVYTLRCGVFATFPIVLGESGPVEKGYLGSGLERFGLGGFSSLCWNQSGPPEPATFCPLSSRELLCPLSSPDPIPNLLPFSDPMHFLSCQGSLCMG